MKPVRQAHWHNDYRRNTDQKLAFPKRFFYRCLIQKTLKIFM
ncbi:hypothetical protein BN137_3656 [Cronobacter condimenti 1330]|uniref:Uncharacterized protein n=1 Tax=Cronobacter condimenti 1330 TaxID=1073999 RepID=K8A304_9ENTR|nr:hypothetical protein BN137_3656 [Cronobacter condimenti 1330]